MILLEVLLIRLVLQHLFHLNLLIVHQHFLQVGLFLQQVAPRWLRLLLFLVGQLIDVVLEFVGQKRHWFASLVVCLE